MSSSKIKCFVCSTKPAYYYTITVYHSIVFEFRVYSTLENYKCYKSFKDTPNSIFHIWFCSSFFVFVWLLLFYSCFLFLFCVLSNNKTLLLVLHERMLYRCRYSGITDRKMIKLFFNDNILRWYTIQFSHKF